MAAEKNQELKCSQLHCNVEKGWFCGFTGEEWKKGSSGCYSCVEIPSVENLLTPGQKEDQFQYCEEVRTALKAGQATMVLGAGISIPMGMPNWQGLVAQMSGLALQYQIYKQTSQEDREKNLRLVQLVQDMVSKKLSIFNGINVLESGQYIAQTLGIAEDKAQREEQLKEVLSVLIRDSKKAETYLAEWLQKKGPASGGDHTDMAQDNSLCAVTYLLQANQGFRRALTYNFDTLVEEYLIGLFGVSSKRVFSHPGRWSTQAGMETKDPIHIFHVHGCVPRPEYKSDSRFAGLQESEHIILSEDSYYDTERYEVYNWQNSIQSFYLNRDNCVFVGFSADDYNFRRILRQIGIPGHGKGKRRKHYLILTIDDLVRDIWISVCRKRFKESNANLKELRRDTITLLTQILKMKAQYWNRYEFYPIWVIVQDIPKVLLSFLES